MEYGSLHPTFCYDLALFDESLGPHEADKGFKLKVHFPKWLVSLPDFQQYHSGKMIQFEVASIVYVFSVKGHCSTNPTSFKDSFHTS